MSVLKRLIGMNACGGSFNGGQSAATGFKQIYLRAVKDL